jgi:hypothetical protein
MSLRSPIMAQAEWDEAAKAAKEWFARRNRVQAWSGLLLALWVWEETIQPSYVVTANSAFCSKICDDA